MSSWRRVLRLTLFGCVGRRSYHVHQQAALMRYLVTQVSVGIEHIQDIIRDFEGALEVVS